MERRLCVRTQIALRRVQRHPVARKIEKHVVHGTAISLVPNALNEVLIHHAHLDLNEIVHVTQDTLSVQVLNLAINLLL